MEFKTYKTLKQHKKCKQKQAIQFVEIPSSQISHSHCLPISDELELSDADPLTPELTFDQHNFI